MKEKKKKESQLNGGKQHALLNGGIPKKNRRKGAHSAFFPKRPFNQTSESLMMKGARG